MVWLVAVQIPVKANDISTSNVIEHSQPASQPASQPVSHHHHGARPHIRGETLNQRVYLYNLTLLCSHSLCCMLLCAWTS